MRQTKATSRTQKFSECGHRPGCAKTLTGQSALKRQVEVSGREPRSHVRVFDDSTQHSQGAVELEWDLEEKVIRFVAHVVEPRAVAEPFRFESPRSRDGSEKRPDAPGEPEDHPKTLHDSSGSVRGASSEPDQGRGSGNLVR